jgi:hypothetical protein
MKHERPQGVWIVKADGAVVPCELAFSHVAEDGQAMWKILTKCNFQQGDRLKADRFPRETA